MIETPAPVEAGDDGRPHLVPRSAPIDSVVPRETPAAHLAAKGEQGRRCAVRTAATASAVEQESRTTLLQVVEAVA
jgi:hypothetical protein